jgi:hypothetical protein
MHFTPGTATCSFTTLKNRGDLHIGEIANTDGKESNEVGEDVHLDVRHGHHEAGLEELKSLVPLSWLMRT